MSGQSGQGEAFIPKLEESANESGEIIIDGSDLKNIQPLSSDAEIEGTDLSSMMNNVIKRTEILDYGDTCFILKDVLTENECAHFIKEGETTGFESVGYSKESYRSCKRYIYCL